MGGMDDVAVGIDAPLCGELWFACRLHEYAFERPLPQGRGRFLLRESQESDIGADSTA
jgi:hypothetical protein